MRTDRTKTTCFSLDAEALASLKALAARRHHGNVSALLAEIARREAKFAAADTSVLRRSATTFTAPRPSAPSLTARRAALGGETKRKLVVQTEWVAQTSLVLAHHEHADNPSCYATTQPCGE